MGVCRSCSYRIETGWNRLPAAETFAKLSPRRAGGDAEGRGGSCLTTATASRCLVEQNQTPSVAPRHLPRKAGENRNRGYAGVSTGSYRLAGI